MKTITVTVEHGKDGFSVYTPDSLFSGFGATIKEAKKDMQQQMQFYKTTCQKDGVAYPAFLDEEVEFVYKFDVQSLLQYYSGILTNAALERLTGINRKQLWSYTHGLSKPREAQVRKIQNALHRLGNELISISL